MFVKPINLDLATYYRLIVLSTPEAASRVKADLKLNKHGLKPFVDLRIVRARYGSYELWGKL